jgi:hypothetical protein
MIYAAEAVRIEMFPVCAESPNFNWNRPSAGASAPCNQEMVTIVPDKASKPESKVFSAAWIPPNLLPVYFRGA